MLLFYHFESDLIYCFTGYMIKCESSIWMANPSNGLRTFLLQAPVVTMCASFHGIKRTHTYKNLHKVLISIIISSNVLSSISPNQETPSLGKKQTKTTPHKSRQCC